MVYGVALQVCDDGRRPADAIGKPNQLPMSFETALRPMIRVADKDTVRRALSHVSSPVITREAARKVTIQPWNANISHLCAPTMPRGLVQN